MDKTLIEMLMKMMGNPNMQAPPQNAPNFDNSAYFSYPQEAFSQSQSVPQNGDNNMLPLLMSLLGKSGSPLAGIMEGASKKNTSAKDDAPPPDDEEILL